MKNGSGEVDEKKAEKIASILEQGYLNDERDEYSIYEIELDVFVALINEGLEKTARAYEGYRKMREYQRSTNTIDNQVWEIIKGTNSEIKDNSNKNPTLISTQRDLVAEAVSKDIAKRMMLPAHLAYAHEAGLIYIHDLGHYLNQSFNCCLVNLEDMLDNGTVINRKMVESPHTFRTACTIATQIVAQVASGQFGGQTVTLSHLAPYVRKSKKYIEDNLKDEWKSCGFTYNKSDFESVVNKRLKKEITDGIQTFQYQINTLQSSNGQSPFLSVFMYISENPEYEEETAMLIEEMLRQRITGMKNEVGVYVTPAFPKLLYVLDENNIPPDSKYRYLTDLACECVSKRMMPDFISAKHMKQNYEGGVFPPMGCRAFLSPYYGGINNTEGTQKWYGRFNMGLTSINLADVGLSAENIENFWKILDERLVLCKESLMLRYEKLKDVKSDVSPIHWQYGAIARLKPGEPIYPLLQDGYATITLGYIGVYECVMALIGKSHTTPEGEKLALQIVQKLKDTVLEWKKETGLGFALYGTPSESLTEYFASRTRERHGVIEGITDRDYLTNSYHVNVEEPIDAFDKLKFESQFHPISSGGCISYCEVANLKDNVEVIRQLVDFMYENVQYAELNSKLDYCHVCGYDGEIICDDNLEWVCPNCGNRDTNKMNIVRRTCGYLGENLWCKGRTEEIKSRYVHVDNKDAE